MSACQHNTWRDADEVNSSGHAVIVRYCREVGCGLAISETLKLPVVDALAERVAKLEGTVSSLATAVAILCGGENK